MKTCSKCHNQSSEDAWLCSSCGYELNPSDSSPPDPTHQRNDRVRRGSWLVFAIWLSLFATDILVAFLAMRSITPVQPGSLTGLVNIPNYLVMGVCLGIGIVFLFFRPRPLLCSLPIAMATVVCYVLFVLVLLSTPLGEKLVGAYALDVQVVDEWGNSVSGIPIWLCLQRTLSLEGTLTPDSEQRFSTDENGKFRINAHSGLRVFCTVNPGPNRKLPYRYSGITIDQRNTGTYSIQYNWSNKAFEPGTNEHICTSHMVHLPVTLNPDYAVE